MIREKKDRQISLHRFPHLNALRAFEAVFRCGGIAQAANELSVTPSAISHQLRQLEADMKVKLVQREGRRVVLSEAGHRLFPSLKEAFRILNACVVEVYEQDTSAPLRVSMLQNFGVNWFFPRLERFQDKHPEIEVEVSFDAHYVDFGRDNVDIAIRHSACSWPDLHCETLFQDSLIATCSQSYLSRHGTFSDPEELLDHTLFVSDGRPADAWNEWFASRNIECQGKFRAIHVSTSHLAMQGAANGVGVAIAGRHLMHEMLQRGALVRIFPYSVPEHGSFYVVCPKDWANRPKIRRFRHWLQEEVRNLAQP